MQPCTSATWMRAAQPLWSARGANRVLRRFYEASALSSTQQVRNTIGATGQVLRASSSSAPAGGASSEEEVLPGDFK